MSRIKERRESRKVAFIWYHQMTGKAKFKGQNPGCCQHWNESECQHWERNEKWEWARRQLCPHEQGDPSHWIALFLLCKTNHAACCEIKRWMRLKHLEDWLAHTWQGLHTFSCGTNAVPAYWPPPGHQRSVQDLESKGNRIHSAFRAHGPTVKEDRSVLKRQRDQPKYQLPICCGSPWSAVIIMSFKIYKI